MTDVVDVVSVAPVVELSLAPAAEVVVVSTGPPGPAGGGGAAAYVHTQAVASASWSIPHNLGYYPTVSVFTVGGVEVEAAPIHTSVNVTVVSFAVPMAGTARLL